MSIRVMTRVWDFGPQKQGHLLVLLALADYANDAGECWPSIKSIARKARMTERGVQKIVRTLEGEGWLKIDTGNGRKGCNCYAINPERRSPPNEVHPEQDDIKTPNDDTETPNDDAETPNEGTPEPSGTVNKPSGEPPETGTGEGKPPKLARLPEGWTPSESEVEYARGLNLYDDDIQEIANDFQIYWTEHAGKGGRKSQRGWEQTWRNRCRAVAPQFIRNRNMAGQAKALRNGQGGGIAGAAARRFSERQLPG